MNYKELPHAPENAQNFDGEDLVKQCPGEASARESQDCLSQRKAGCMNFAVYKFIFPALGVWCQIPSCLLTLTVLFAWKSLHSTEG